MLEKFGIHRHLHCLREYWVGILTRYSWHLALENRRVCWTSWYESFRITVSYWSHLESLDTPSERIVSNLYLKRNLPDKCPWFGWINTTHHHSVIWLTHMPRCVKVHGNNTDHPHVYICVFLFSGVGLFSSCFPPCLRVHLIPCATPMHIRSSPVSRDRSTSQSQVVRSEWEVGMQAL